MARPIESLLEARDAVTQLAVEFGPRLLSATLVLVAGFIVMRWVAGLAARGLARFALEPPRSANCCCASCGCWCSCCSC